MLFRATAAVKRLAFCRPSRGFVDVTKRIMNADVVNAQKVKEVINLPEKDEEYLRTEDGLLVKELPFDDDTFLKMQGLLIRNFQP